MEKNFNMAETNVDSYKKISWASIEFKGHQYNVDNSLFWVYKMHSYEQRKTLDLTMKVIWIDLKIIN